MAIKRGEFFSGSIGPIVFKVINGKQVVCSKPSKGQLKHSAATKRNNKLFGMSASLAAQLRYTLSYYLSKKHDGSMCHRLTGKFYAALKAAKNPDTQKFDFDLDSFRILQNFNFNKYSQLNSHWSNWPVLILEDGRLTIKFNNQFDPDSLQFPPQCFSCRISINVSLFRLKEGKVVLNAQKMALVINKTDVQLPQHEFNFVVPDGCFYVVSLFVEYLHAWGTKIEVANARKHNPGAIYAARISPGIYQPGDNFEWDKMIKF